MTHALLAHPRLTRLALPLCALAALVGGLALGAHGQAVSAHAVSFLISPIRIQ
jgi:hypothetical protein